MRTGFAGYACPELVEGACAIAPPEYADTAASAAASSAKSSVWQRMYPPWESHLQLQPGRWRGFYLQDTVGRADLRALTQDDRARLDARLNRVMSSTVRRHAKSQVVAAAAEHAA
jgi:hypothetical protein